MSCSSVARRCAEGVCCAALRVCCSAAKQVHAASQSRVDAMCWGQHPGPPAESFFVVLCTQNWRGRAAPLLSGGTTANGYCQKDWRRATFRGQGSYFQSHRTAPGCQTRRTGGGARGTGNSGGSSPRATTVKGSACGSHSGSRKVRCFFPFQRVRFPAPEGAFSCLSVLVRVRVRKGVGVGSFV